MPKKAPIIAAGAVAGGLLFWRRRRKKGRAGDELADLEAADIQEEVPADA